MITFAWKYCKKYYVPLLKYNRFSNTKTEANFKALEYFKISF